MTRSRLEFLAVVFILCGTFLAAEITGVEVYKIASVVALILATKASVASFLSIQILNVAGISETAVKKFKELSEKE